MGQRNVEGFGDPGKNNGGRLIVFCDKRGLSLSTTYFEHKSLHKYTMVGRSQDGVDVMSMIDLVLVKKAMLL